MIEWVWRTGGVIREKLGNARKSRLNATYSITGFSVHAEIYLYLAYLCNHKRRREIGRLRIKLKCRHYNFQLYLCIRFTYKIHPITGHKGPVGSRLELYVSFTLGARWGWVVTATPRPFYSRERPGTHCIGGWLGPRAGLDGCGKSRPHRHLIPGPSRP
jgi:hypothetical protein